MPRKRKEALHPPVDPAEVAPQAEDGKKAEKKKNKNPEAHRRIRNVAFVLIVVFLLGIIASMVASQLLPEYEILSLPRKAIATVMQPIQQTFSTGTGWFFEYIQRLKLRNNIEYEYEKLYDKYDDLLSQVMLVNELQQQLDEYSDLMNEMQTHSQFDGVPAKVISTDSTNYFSALQINIGSNQGIQDYMAVVKSGGLVGYTYNVTPTTAMVQTIINSDTSIPALIDSTRYQGTVKGTMGVTGDASCRMYYLNESHLPRQGDLVVTSGVGVEFPKGIPIGYVRESTRGMEEGKSYVVIEPIVDFERIEYVIVYRYVPTYAEQAEQRDESTLTYTGLPTQRPIPTFMLSGNEGFNVSETATPGPGEETVIEETPVPEITPDPDMTPDPDATDAPEATPTVANLSYDDIPGTPTPLPTPTPQPTPSPTPTFSLNSLTQEGEE